MSADDGETAVAPLDSFPAGWNAAVIGASGGIGGAFADRLERTPGVGAVLRLSRSRPLQGADRWLPLDLDDEASIAAAADAARTQLGALHLVIVATGVLHAGSGLQPEKTWRSLNAFGLETAFRVNAVGPALAAKHFLPLLAGDAKSVFAALSARVGSISDNRLGGWHAYRASKAALNMLIKTLAIELARRNGRAVCVGLHPGTVDTGLSKPFQGGVPEARLFSPDGSAARLLQVIDTLSPGDSGNLFAWDGSLVAP